MTKKLKGLEMKHDTRERWPVSKNMKPKKVETLTIDDMLVICYGNFTKVARLLGVNRGTVRNIYVNKRPHLITFEVMDDLVTYQLLK